MYPREPFSLLTSLEVPLLEFCTWSHLLHAFHWALCLPNVLTDVNWHASLARCNTFSFFLSPALIGIWYTFHFLIVLNEYFYSMYFISQMFWGITRYHLMPQNCVLFKRTTLINVENFVDARRDSLKKNSAICLFQPWWWWFFKEK